MVLSSCKRDEHPRPLPRAEVVDARAPAQPGGPRYDWSEIRTVVEDRVRTCGLSQMAIAFSVRTTADAFLFVDEVILHSKGYSWPCVRDAIRGIHLIRPFPPGMGCALVLVGAPSDAGLKPRVIVSEDDFFDSGLPAVMMHEHFSIGVSYLQPACPTRLDEPLAVSSPYSELLDGSTESSLP